MLQVLPKPPPELLESLGPDAGTVPAGSLACRVYFRVDFPRMLHKSLVRGLARPLNAGLFEPIGACASSSHG